MIEVTIAAMVCNASAKQLPWGGAVQAKAARNSGWPTHATVSKHLWHPLLAFFPSTPKPPSLESSLLRELCVLSVLHVNKCAGGCGQLVAPASCIPLLLVSIPGWDTVPGAAILV